MQQVKAQERDEIDSAAEEVVDAVDDHLTAVQGASSANAEADRIRRITRDRPRHGRRLVPSRDHPLLVRGGAYRCRRVTARAVLGRMLRPVRPRPRRTERIRLPKDAPA